MCGLVTNFFISTQKHGRGYQKVEPGKINHKNAMEGEQKKSGQTFSSLEAIS